MRHLRADLEEKHAKEMVKVRKYFEQKCLEMEKQYSDEVFSQQSKKVSDNDSEIEELTNDLFDGGSIECSGGGGDPPAKSIDKTDSLSITEQKNNVFEDKNTKIVAEYEEKLANVKKQLQEFKEHSGRTLLLKTVNQVHGFLLVVLLLNYFFLNFY